MPARPTNVGNPEMLFVISFRATISMFQITDSEQVASALSAVKVFRNVIYFSCERDSILNWQASVGRDESYMHRRATGSLGCQRSKLLQALFELQVNDAPAGLVLRIRSWSADDACWRFIWNCYCVVGAWTGAIVRAVKQCHARCYR